MAIHLPLSADAGEWASAWMHRGIDLMKSGAPADLQEAVRSFDEAISIRCALPRAESPRLRYGRAAGWINRGDALARLGATGHLAEAVRSYDEALALLQTLPLEEDPLYPRRLAIAWINRGLVRQKEDFPADAADCFRAAISVLEHAASFSIPGRSLLKAGALINLAGALLEKSEASATEARSAANEARALLDELDRSDPTVEEAAIKARHLLCRAIAAESRNGKSVPPELAAEARKAVDEGLDLIRRAECRGEHGFCPLGEDLFRFGCRVRPPADLADFILENLDPEKTAATLPISPDTHTAAVAALWKVLEEIQRDGFHAVSTPDFNPMLEKVRLLRIAEQRLEQLRPAISAPARTILPPKSG